jgi:hypothetical protein
MTTLAWVAIIVFAVVALTFIAWMISRSRRAIEQLRQHYGPEYERLEKEHGKSRAEKILQAREERVDQFNIHPLSSSQRDQFTNDWRSVQAEFVSDPGGAVEKADQLWGQVMRAEGYPMEDFEERAADISVEHPDVVEKYREAHKIEQDHKQRKASTEDLRKAMIDYQALFESLVASETGRRAGA